jgi:hypothetical protein
VSHTEKKIMTTIQNFALSTGLALVKIQVFWKFLESGQVIFFVTPIDECTELVQRLLHGCSWPKVWLGKES